MVALESTVWCVLGCWLTISTIKVPCVLPWQPLAGSRMSSRSLWCILPLAGLIPWRWTNIGRPNWREAMPWLSPAKCCDFKSDKYDGQSAGVQNSAKSSWAVLVVWAGAESAKRHIFHQDMSSRPRGPHGVSKAKHLVGVAVNTFASKNRLSEAKIRKICHSFPLQCFFPPICRDIRSLLLFNSFFTLETIFLLFLTS